MMLGLCGSSAASSSLSRSTTSGHTPRLLAYAAAAACLLLGLAVTSAVLLEPRRGQLAVFFAHAASAGAAVIACIWTAARTRGAERLWRLLIGAMVGGSLITSLAHALTELAGRTVYSRAVGPGYFVLLVLYGSALAGLLSLPTDPVEGHGRHAGGQRHGACRWDAITVLDCVLIVGSILLLEWGILLEPIVRAGAVEPGWFLVNLFHMTGALILASAVALIAAFRRPRSPAALAFLGAGLLTFALSTNLFVYRVAHGKIDSPPWTQLGYDLALLLIFLAVLVPVPAPTQEDSPASLGLRTMWAHAVLPYLALCAAVLPIVGRLLTTTPIGYLEVYGIVGLLLVALIRQMITLAENIWLLTEIRGREQQLHYQAFHDPLTGLANRALFTRRLQRALESNPRDYSGTGVAEPVSVLFLDFDEFKWVNDVYGHAAGDELLRISAERLRAGTREADTVARVGGDEFAVILDGADPDHPRRIGERLAAAVQTPCLLAGRLYTPRASLGLATFDESVHQPDSPEILLHHADLAMYAAKRERSGRLVIYQPDLPISTNYSHPAEHFEDDSPVARSHRS